jgi:flagellar protein FlaG
MSIESVENVNSFFSFHGIDTVEDVPKTSHNKSSLEKTENPVEQKKENLTREKVEKTIDSLETISNALNTRLSFSVDEKTGRNIIRVLNSDTGDLIRQIPAQEMLDLLSKLRGVIGVPFDEEA